MFGCCGFPERFRRRLAAGGALIVLLTAAVSAAEEEYIPPPQPSPEDEVIPRPRRNTPVMPRPKPSRPSAHPKRTAPPTQRPTRTATQPAPSPAKAAPSPSRPAQQTRPSTSATAAGAKTAEPRKPLPAPSPEDIPSDAAGEPVVPPPRRTAKPAKGRSSFGDGDELSLDRAVSPARGDGMVKGVIITELATVFKSPDFDGEVMGTLPQGHALPMSKGKTGAFYRVTAPTGGTGWVSEAEIRPLGGEPEAAQSGSERRGREQEEERSRPSQSSRSKFIHRNRYGGVAAASVSFLEDTMGQLRGESLMFYGLRFSGPGVIVDGLPTDAEILFHVGAPTYYQRVTGNPADGMIMIANFLFLTDLPQSRSVMASYGFGPMVRISQFRMTLNNDPTVGKTRSYEATDVTLGAVFGAGVAIGLGSRYAVRLDGRYYWEAQRYGSMSLALQMDF